MKRSALALLTVLAAAALVGGCGGASSGGSASTAPKQATAPNAPAGSKVVACDAEAAQLRATAVDCETARTTMEQWEGSDACALGAGDSRGSCSLGSFRCQAVKVDEGVSVGCAGPEGDVSFIKKPAG